MLQRVIYSSGAVEQMSADDLAVILRDAREGNAAKGITGVLVYADGTFLQILEGEASVVRTLVANIEHDSRHQDMKVFYQAEASARTFASWHMAYLAPTDQELATWMGHEGTATINQLLEHVHENEAHLPHVLVSIVDALSSS